MKGLLVALGSAILLLSGCAIGMREGPFPNHPPANIPGAQATPGKPSSVVEPTFGAQGTVTPATLRAYVEQARLDQANQIVFFDPQLKQNRIITDRGAIQRIVDLLLTPPDKVDPTLTRPQQLLFIMHVPVGSGEYPVSVDYRAETNEVELQNVLTGYLPILIQGTYPAPATLGPALLEVLMATSTLEPLVTPDPAEKERSTSPDATPAGWRTYSDPTLGFSLAYPATAEVCDLWRLADYSRAFCRRPPQTGQPQDFPSSFYVHRASPDVLAHLPPNTDLSSAYSLVDRDTLADLLALPTGGAYTPTNRSLSFVRLPDITIAGSQGVVVESEDVLSSRMGSRVRRVLVMHGSDSWQFSTSYAEPEELRNFEQVLATLRFASEPQSGSLSGETAEARPATPAVATLAPQSAVTRSPAAESMDEQLAELLRFQQLHPLYQFRPAKVIARLAGASSDAIRNLTLGVGTDQGIQPGMPVVTSRGLVGEISGVESSSSVVQLITDVASVVPVTILKNGLAGMVHGEEDGLPVMAIGALRTDLASGDVVVTSGLHGRLPKGLIVGQIAGFVEQGDAAGQPFVRPAVDFAQLEVALVITHSERQAPGADATPAPPTPTRRPINALAPTPAASDKLAPATRLAP